MAGRASQAARRSGAGRSEVPRRQNHHRRDCALHCRRLGWHSGIGGQRPGAMGFPQTPDCSHGLAGVSRVRRFLKGVHRPKSILAAAALWLEGDTGDDTESNHGWQFGDDQVEASPSPAIFSMWYENRRSGIWPRAGGWLDQPLSLLVQMKAIELTVDTKQYLMSKES